MVEAAEEAFL